MTDTRNAAQLREMLRIQFEEAAGIASDPATSALFAKLAATTNDIPAATLDTYSELFEDFTGSEIEREMMGSVGVSWWPKSARGFVEKFISISTGG
jgi:hypothetical protein